MAMLVAIFIVKVSYGASIVNSMFMLYRMQDNGRALLGAGADLQLPPMEPGTGLHILQPIARGKGDGVKTCAVVCNLHAEIFAGWIELNDGSAGFGMPHHIVDGFLENE